MLCHSQLTFFLTLYWYVVVDKKFEKLNIMYSLVYYEKLRYFRVTK
jgi:hypothetical protein